MTYVSPMVETIELKIGAMLCQSQSPSTVNNPFGNTDEELIQYEKDYYDFRSDGGGALILQQERD